MNRSSKEQAIAERRLRLSVSEDGVVQEVLLPRGLINAPSATSGAQNDALTELFGFPPEQLLGCQLWDFMSLASDAVPGARQQASQMQASNQQQRRDVLAEAEALIQAGSRYSSGAVLSIDGAGGGPSCPLRVKGWTGGSSMDRRMLENMVTSSLQTPGISWRVNVVPPNASVEAAAIGNPERAAAVLARRAKHGVLRLDVTLPRPGARSNTGSGGRLLVHAELWLADAVTGVLEIDGTGKVSGILEEDVRPPGLLFGLPKEEILGSPLGTLLRLLPGQSPVGLLTDSGIAKKSALKASSKKGKIVDKVGPVHYLEGFHRDHQPLKLAVQVVGKPGPGNPVTAIVRFASQKPSTNKRSSRPQAASGPGFSAGAAAHVEYPPSNGPRSSHVQVSLNGNEPSLTQPRSGTIQLPIPSRLGSVNGSYLSSRFREANSFRSCTEPQQQLTTARTALKSSGGGGGISVRTLTRGVQSMDGSRVVPAAAATATGISCGDGEFARLTLASTISAVNLMPEPARGSSNLTAMATAVSDTTPLAAMAAVTTEPATVASLPGAVALANGVTSVLSSRSLRKADSPSDNPRVVAAAAAATTTAVPLLGSVDTGSSSPPKPESPPTASPSKRPIASASPRADADLGVLIEQPVPSGGPTGGLALVCAMKALRESGGNNQGVDKWVASGGQFFKNETQSLMEAELDVEEEDDDAGSFGATSRATSSHWMSPTGSRNFNDPSEDVFKGADGRRGGAGEFNGGLHHRGNPVMPPGGLVPRGGVDGGGNGWQRHLHPQGFDESTDPDPMRLGLDPWEAPLGLEEGAGYERLGGPEGATAEMPPLEEVPDDRSDGGESAYSGISGASGFSDGDTPADFQRGKRYRKLVKLMDSPEAQRTVVRMKIHTALTLLAASAIHIVCFALVITAIKKQSHAMDNMADAGHSQVHLQRILVQTRALDQAYDGKGTNYTYSLADVQTLSRDIMTDCQGFRGINNDLLNQLAHDMEALYYGREVTVWSGINATTNVSYSEAMSLWDLMTRVFVSAKTIFQSHEEWYRQHIQISSTLAGSFLFNSGQALIPGMSEVMNTLLDIAVQKTNAVKMLQLTFLIIEGFLVTCISAIVMIYILRSVCDQRYHLYETFLKIPVGLTRALASQTTHLLDDDESDEDEEEDGSQLDNIEDGGAATSKRKALFEDGNGATNGQDQGGSVIGGGRTRRGSNGSETMGRLMYGGGGGPPRGNARQRRASGAVYGAKANRMNDDSSRGLLASAAANRARGGGGGGSTEPLYEPPLASTERIGSLSSPHYYLTASASDRERSHHRRGRGGWLGRLFGKIWGGSLKHTSLNPGY
ncbi:hypothetical protein Vafri_484 [Volvox africanus]|nr:hypothetical protein Vafri_484 [Volvox africanus]